MRYILHAIWDASLVILLVYLQNAGKNRTYNFIRLEKFHFVLLKNCSSLFKCILGFLFSYSSCIACSCRWDQIKIQLLQILGT